MLQVLQSLANSFHVLFLALTKLCKVSKMDHDIQSEESTITFLDCADSMMVFAQSLHQGTSVRDISPYCIEDLLQASTYKALPLQVHRKPQFMLLRL